MDTMELKINPLTEAEIDEVHGGWIPALITAIGALMGVAITAYVSYKNSQNSNSGASSGGGSAPNPGGAMSAACGSAGVASGNLVTGSFTCNTPSRTVTVTVSDPVEIDMGNSGGW